jgi:hypothetical protein
MDVRYRISGRFVSDPALVSPPLLPDSKVLRSESEIFATSARGSWGGSGASTIANSNLVSVGHG